MGRGFFTSEPKQKENTMSYDLWGQMLGKARRRQLEGNLKVNALPIVQGLLGGGLTAGSVAALVPGLLASSHAVPALGAAFLGGLIPFGASQAKGIMTPAASGTQPLIPAIVQAVSILANKPKAAAQTKADNAAKAAQAQADANQLVAKEAAARNAEVILNAQQLAISQQQEADAARRAEWEAEAEQFAETVLKKYLEKTGEFNNADLGKAEAVIGEAEAVAEELPQSGVVGTVTGALHAAGEFVAGLVTKTDPAAPEEPAKETTT